MLKLLFAGDLYPVGKNEEVFSSKSLYLEEKSLFFNQYDYVITNLESPLADNSTPILKYGPVLKAPTKTSAGIKSLGIDCVTLANNHIFDHGDAGMVTTIETLQKVGLDFFGGGRDLTEASKIFHLEKNNEKICFLAYADQEFNSATPKSGGANPFDVPRIVKDIIHLPKDLIKIVIIHGGNEHLSIPNPQLRSVCHLIIDLGVDLVVCHHSHCIGAYEKYGDGEIYYSLGNFLFSVLPQKMKFIHRKPVSDNKSWNQGIFLSVDIDDHKIKKTEPIPFIQNRIKGLFDFPEKDELSQITDEMKNINNILQDEEKYQKVWLEHCRRHQKIYNGLLTGGNRLFYLACKYGLDPMRIFRSKWGKNNIGLVHRCVAHSEVIKTLYKNKITENK